MKKCVKSRSCVRFTAISLGYVLTMTDLVICKDSNDCLEKCKLYGVDKVLKN